MEEQALIVASQGWTIDGGYHYANTDIPGGYVARSYFSAFPGQVQYMQKLPVIVVDDKNKRI